MLQLWKLDLESDIGTGTSPQVCVPDSFSRVRAGGGAVVRRAQHFLSWHLQCSLLLLPKSFLYKQCLYIMPRLKIINLNTSENEGIEMC